MADITSEDRRYLRQYLTEKFNLSELKTLSFDLGIDYEMFPHATKPEFSRELLAYFERKDRLHPLVRGMIEARPDDELTQLLARLPEKDGLQKVQIILSNDKINSKPDLRQKLAELLGISTEEVMLIATAAGSIKLLVGLPATVVPELTGLALPYRLGEYEIVAVQPYIDLPRAERNRWRSIFEAASGGLAGAGGIGLLGKVLLWMLGTVGMIVLLGGGGAALWWQGLPQLRLVNECGVALPVPVPDVGRNILGLPEEIPPGGSANFRVVSGAGTYRLVLEERPRREIVVLQLPRTLPIVNTDRLELGPVDPDTRFVLNGRPVEIPSEFRIASGQANELILCAQRN